MVSVHAMGSLFVVVGSEENHWTMGQSNYDSPAVARINTQYVIAVKSYWSKVRLLQ